MSYRHAMLAITVVCALTSIPVILFPTAVSTMMGAPADANIATICGPQMKSNEALAIMVACVIMGLGILTFAFRNFTDPNTQKTILGAILVSTIVTFVGASSGSLGFFPLFASTTNMAILLAGLYGQRKHRAAPVVTTAEETPAEA